MRVYYTDVIFTDTSFACISGEEDNLKEVEMIFCLPETLPSSKDNKTDLAIQEGGDTENYVVALLLQIINIMCSRSFTSVSGKVGFN